MNDAHRLGGNALHSSLKTKMLRGRCLDIHPVFRQGKGSGRLTVVAREKDRKHSETFGVGQPVRIGRSSDNDLVLSSPYVARHQCTLVWQNTRLFLQQQDVKNRITILRSGKGIDHPGEMERLQDRDVLKIADVSLEISLSGKS